MKKYISIIFLGIAIITLMAHSIIPHHEHEDRVCFEDIRKEMQASDNATTHSHTKTLCLDNQDIIRNQNELDSKQNCTHGSDCDFHFPPIILFLGNFFDFESKQDKVDTPNFGLLYTSVDIYSTNTRRGPPQA